MKKLFLGLFVIISTFMYSQECSQSDVQRAYLTVSMNESMTISDAEFSLSDTTKVNFAVGNLMYRPSTKTWKIADHQYDFVGGYRTESTQEDLIQKHSYGNIWEFIGGKYTKCENTGGKNINVSNTNYEGWIDLFPQDSVKNLNLIDTVHNLEYRTPTYDEFHYLVNGRKDYSKLRARARIILSPDTFVNGLILLPDMPDNCSSIEDCILKIMPDTTRFLSDYDGCWYYTDNIFTPEQWKVLEGQGAIFLPAGGGVNYKDGVYTSGIKYNRSGFYWTWNTSKSLEFGGYTYNGQNCMPSFVDRCDARNRRSIRVVAVKKPVETPVAVAQKSCNDYTWHKNLIKTTGGQLVIDSIDECTRGLKAIPKNGYKFAYLKDLGSISFDDSVTLEIDTAIQNYVYEASFVKDNAFIYKWLDDSIIIRTDTTDLLSTCNNPGWTYTVVNGATRMLDEDERISKLDWGIWKADITELINNNEYAGQPLHMIIHNACGKPTAVIDTIIPVVVHDIMYAHTMDFHSDIPHTDLQVVEDAILYVDSDIIINGILDIHEGGKVIVNENKTLETQGIILRGDGLTKKWAQLLIKGEVINNSEDLIFYDYTLNSSKYYPLSLPDTVQCSLIKSSITGNATQYQSYSYNTLARNEHNSGWEVFNDEAVGAQYILGNGYIVYSPVNRWKNNAERKQETNIIRYPIRVDLSNEKENKTIDIYGSTDESIKPSDKNWNLIGNPYLSNFVIGAGSNIVELLQSNEESINYITYSNDGYLTYEQTNANGFVMKPFNSYFIQTISDGAIEFERDNLQHHAPVRVNYNNGTIKTGITLIQNDRTEHIGLLYGDYTDEYEINADLAKMFGNANVLYAYSLSNDDKLAFQAVSVDSIYPIPVGYKNAKLQPMTFAFDNARYINEGLSGIWLYDSKLNKHINLLNENYTFSPNASNEDNRFYITIEFEMNITTDLNTINIENKTEIFDILGRKIPKTYKAGVYILYENKKYIKVIR